MGQKIWTLPSLVIDQIAAGEVVENPSSVVKELVENSLDAGATKIRVRIEEGGLSCIEVIDDGCGMGREDALACFVRHATSKLVEFSDLERLQTMGFRGEALAAISAVARVDLSTFDGEVGTQVCSVGGEVELLGPCVRNKGTSICVSSLFHTVPARRQFQKSSRACSQQIQRGIERWSLSHPEVEITLFGENGVLFSRPSESLRERVEGVLGVFPHFVEREGIIGFFGSPSDASRTRAGQYLFVNGRSVVSSLVATAVQQGYATRLSSHTYPSFVLFLSLDPSLVDCNVHPQKKEVRFLREKELFSSVQRAVEEGFFVKSPTEVRKTFSPPPSFSLQERAFQEAFPVQKEEPLSFPFPPLQEKGKIVCLLGKYALEKKDGYRWIDLDRVRARIAWENRAKEAPLLQPLLFPWTLPIQEEGEVEALSLLHIRAVRVGKREVWIEELPHFLEAGDVEEFLRQYRKGKDPMRALAASFLPRKTLYSMEEAERLVEEMQTCQDTVQDPLGRPLWRLVEEGDIAAWIG